MPRRPLSELLLVPASQVSTLPVNERCRLAACPRASPDVLDAVYEDPNPRVRTAFARNEAACLYDVDVLAGDDDVRVRLAVAHPRRVREDTLVSLACDRVPAVRQALFRRRDLSSWLLDMLSQFGNPEVVAEVRQWRAHHPRRREQCWG